MEQSTLISSGVERTKNSLRILPVIIYWKTGDFQDIINCGANELAMGLCSSSSRGDCARDAMAIKCCALTTFKTPESDCQWLFPQTYGAENFCPTDKYAGTCGVGRWNTDYCSSY